MHQPESVTDAVIVCVPTLKALVEKLAPDPMTPFTLDDQDKLALRLPVGGIVGGSGERDRRARDERLRRWPAP